MRRCIMGFVVASFPNCLMRSSSPVISIVLLITYPADYGLGFTAKKKGTAVPLTIIKKPKITYDYKTYQPY